MTEHLNYIYSKYNKIWDTNIYDGFIGNKLQVSNLSTGYHGILKQWWDEYNTGSNVLLVSENNKVKAEFQLLYPTWNITTTDLFIDINTSNEVDIVGDICSLVNPIVKKYNLIINQATLEHLYNPFQGMYNLISSLELGGILVTHTHPPAFDYHQYPRDYFRFMIDWWIDLEKYIKNIELLEICMINNKHVLTVYRKL